MRDVLNVDLAGFGHGLDKERGRKVTPRRIFRSLPSAMSAAICCARGGKVLKMRDTSVKEIGAYQH